MATAEKLRPRIGETIRFYHPPFHYAALVVGITEDGTLLVEVPDDLRDKLTDGIFDPYTGQVKGLYEFDQGGQRTQRLLDSVLGERFVHCIAPNDSHLRADSLRQFINSPLRCLLDALLDRMSY